MVNDDVRLVELASVIRLSLQRRTADAHLVEDITQDTMVRVAAAAPQLDPHALRAYAIVTARNGLNTHLRSQRIARRHAHRVVDYTTLDGAEELTLEREETNALAEALDTLNDADRRLLLDHEVDDLSVAALAERHDTTVGAVAMRLARARALLRVEFLLAFRRVTLRSEHCRQVLLAISTGDQRRQAALGAADHLLTCDECSELSQPLLQRRRGAAAWWFMPVPVWLKRFVHRLRSSRSAQTLVAVAVAAALIGAVLVADGARQTSSGPGSATTDGVPTSTIFPTTAAAVAPPVPAPAPPPSTVSTSTTASPPAHDCPPAEAPAPPDPTAGCMYTFTDMAVTDVSANEGFWIRFTDDRPIWVHLVGRGESPQHVVAGDHVTVRATINPVATAADSGVPHGQLAQLTARGFYLAVMFDELQVRPA